MLGNVGDGAAILAAQAQALDHPQTEEDERRAQTDLLVGRDQPDRPRAQPHSAERNKERILAADPIAHPSEEERPQWTDQESCGEQRNRTEQSCDRVGLFKELDRQNCGQAAEDIEVIPFDDVSHRRSNNHAAEIPRNLNCHVWLLLFQGIASIFQRFVSRGAKVHARRLQARIVSASTTPGLRGTLNHLRESSNGLRCRELPLPPSHLSGSESAKNSVIPNRTAAL